MKVFYLISFLFLFVACGSDDVNCPYASLPIAIESPDELTLQAMDIWNEAMGVEIFESAEDGVTVTYVDSLDGFVRGRTYWSCGGGYKAWSDIDVEDGHSDKATIGVICHELGHVVGMRHTDYGIMKKAAPSSKIEENVKLMEDYFLDLYPE